MLKTAYTGMPPNLLIHKPIINQSPLRSPLSQAGTFPRTNGFMLKEYGLNGVYSKLYVFRYICIFLFY